MSYTAYVQGTPFNVVGNVDFAYEKIDDIIMNVMSGEGLELELIYDGKCVLQMLDTQDVGDSFASRVGKVVKRIQPIVSSAFQVTVRNCETSDDVRDQVF